jgi:transcriptional regulator with GAF, ATPase, and Fis domain
MDGFTQFSKLIVKALIRSHEIRSPFPSINDYLAEYSIEELERKRLITILARHDWRRAYRAAGIPHRTVYSVMARLGIKRPKLENFAAKSAAQSA